MHTHKHRGRLIKSNTTSSIDTYANVFIIVYDAWQTCVCMEL